MGSLETKWTQETLVFLKYSDINKEIWVLTNKISKENSSRCNMTVRNFITEKRVLCPKVTSNGRNSKESSSSNRKSINWLRSIKIILTIRLKTVNSLWIRKERKLMKDFKISLKRLIQDFKACRNKRKALSIRWKYLSRLQIKVKAAEVTESEMMI